MVDRDTVREWVREAMAEMDLDWRNRVEERQVAVETNVVELADVVLGTPRSELAGGGRHSDGLVHDVRDVRERLGNGGIKIKLPWQFWGTALTVTGAIIVALIQG